MCRADAPRNIQSRRSDTRFLDQDERRKAEEAERLKKEEELQAQIDAQTKMEDEKKVEEDEKKAEEDEDASALRLAQQLAAAKVQADDAGDEDELDLDMDDI